VGRANRYGLDLAASIGEANSRIAAMAIIESVRGVENAAEIAAVRGLDAIVIGAGDLAAELGVFDQPSDTRLQDAIEHVAGCAREAGLRIGGAGARRPPEERESELVICFNDTVGVAGAARAAIEAARAA